MKKWYVTQFDPKRAVSSLSGRDESARVAKAQEDFLPMYYIKNVS